MITDNKFNIPNADSHMPFLMRSSHGSRVLFSCQNSGEKITDELRCWKVHYSIEGSTPVRLNTGLSADVVECSPSAWHDAAGWHVTFIAGGSLQNPRYYLYRMDSPNLVKLGQAKVVHPCRSGFVYKKRLVVGELNDVFYIHDETGDYIINIPGIYIMRLSYRADCPDYILITGTWIGEGKEVSVEYNWLTGEQNLIECDGMDTYKLTLYEETALYTVKVGEHFEDRQIVEAKSVNRIACSLIQSKIRDDFAIINRSNLP
jgi:hypothetical protein